MSLAVLNGFNKCTSRRVSTASLVEYRPYSASIIGAVVCCDPAVVVLKLVLELQ